MSISEILQSFNWAMDEARGNQEGYFLASATSIKKGIGPIKTITISVYLVDKTEKYSREILREQYTNSIPEENKEKCIESMSLGLIKNLVLIFKDHLQELIDGTYGIE